MSAYVVFFAAPMPFAALIVAALDHGYGPRCAVQAWQRWMA